MTSEDEDFICETCRKIDFQDLVQNPRQEEYQWQRGEPSPYTIRYSHGCKLCRLMFQNVFSCDMYKTFELRSYSFKKLSNWARNLDAEDRVKETTLDARDSIVLKIGLYRPNDFFLRPYEDVFCTLASDDLQDSNCAQPVQDLWDCVKARSWMETCTRCHGSVCEHEVLEIPGMNLIDCKDMVIVKAAQEMRWLALSYVWGANSQTADPAGYRVGSNISLDTPATIRDAISVTLQLGYRYLWVDEYCIDQNDDSHRNDQINKMDRIYMGSDLTIVAAAGKSKTHGLPGVGSTKRRDREVIRVEDVVVFSNGPDPVLQARETEWFTRACSCFHYVC
jgi:hypothetical protein